MKYILALLSLFTISSFREEFTTEFDQEVNEAYSEYQVTEYHNPDDYGLKLVKGILDGKMRYGFSFYSENSKDYYLRVLHENTQYQVATDKRGDIQAIALNLKEGDSFSILIYHSSSQIVEPLEALRDIKIISESEFRTLEGIQIGLGEGASLTRLKTEFSFDQNDLFYLFSFLIILSCAIIIFVFYKRRQGMFNKEIRAQNVFNFREFISSNFEAPINENEYAEAEYEVIEDLALDDEKVEEENSSYFERHYSWARDDDERSGFDIQGYLQDKGYLTDYHLLSENEKNLIMLELMRLKDEKRITRDEYLEETANLWKS